MYLFMIANTTCVVRVSLACFISKVKTTPTKVRIRGKRSAPYQQKQMRERIICSTLFFLHTICKFFLLFHSFQPKKLRWRMLCTKGTYWENQKREVESEWPPLNSFTLIRFDNYLLSYDDDQERRTRRIVCPTWTTPPNDRLMKVPGSYIQP